MKTHIRSVATDLLWVLRSVESTPDGDIAWAEHCTRQQAAIVRLNLPRGKVTSIDVLTEAVGIPDRRRVGYPCQRHRVLHHDRMAHPHLEFSESHRPSVGGPP